MEVFNVIVRDKITGKEKSMSFPVEKSDFESAMIADNLEFTLHECNVIPEMNGAAFAKNASFAELNFLAKRIEKICEEQTQICA